MKTAISAGTVGTTSGLIAAFGPSLIQLDMAVRITGGLVALAVSCVSLLILLRKYIRDSKQPNRRDET